MKADDVINFWFSELKPQDWWRKSETLDGTIRDRFASCHEQARALELWAWRETPAGRLAEIIVLDQFSRNMFRDDPRAFAQDGIALALAQEAVAAGHDQKLPKDQRAFLYMPYMHSESMKVHEVSLRLFEEAGLEGNLKAAHAHVNIIKRFGRYPHRNKILGRTSSAEEEAFLKEPGSSF